MQIEAYIITEQVTRHYGMEAGVGIMGTLPTTIFSDYYKDGAVYNISDMIVANSIQGWRENMDLKDFAKFESSDISFTVSLINDVGGEIESLLNSVHLQEGNTKEERWRISIYLPNYDKGFMGIIDLDKITWSLETKDVKFTAYGGMQELALVPASSINRIIEAGASQGFSSFHKWYNNISPTDAIDKILYNGEYFNFAWVTTGWWTGGTINPGTPSDFFYWALSFEDLPDLEFIDLYQDDDIVDICWDGQYLWITWENGAVLKGSVDASHVWTWEDGSGDIDAQDGFYKWENQYSLTEEPDSAIPSSLAPVFDIPGEITIGADKYTPYGIPYFDYTNPSNPRLFQTAYIQADLSLSDAEIEILYIDFNGYTAGVAQWGNWTVWDTTTVHITGARRHITLIPFNDDILYYTTGRKIYKWRKSTSTSTRIVGPRDGVDEPWYDHIYHFKQSNLFMVERRYENGTFGWVQIRHGSDCSWLYNRNGQVEPEKEWNDYNLDWEDMDLSSLMEVSVDYIPSGSVSYVGLTKRSPRRFFMLNSDFSKCIYYTNLEEVGGLKEGTKCHITRRIVSDVSGDSIAIHGYIGTGNFTNGVIFSYRLGHSGNIRVLNLEKLSVADALAEVAKFSNSIFYVDSEKFTDGLGRNVMENRVNIISRQEIDVIAENHNIDYDGKFNIKPRYKNFAGVVKVKYAGGNTTIGAEIPPPYLNLPGMALVEKENALYDRIYNFPSKSINFKFIYDENYAQYAGKESLKFLWTPRQQWDIDTQMKNFKLLDTVTLEQGKAQIIVIDPKPSEDKACLTCIKKDPSIADYVPDNPLPGGGPAVPGDGGRVAYLDCLLNSLKCAGAVDCIWYYWIRATCFPFNPIGGCCLSAQAERNCGSGYKMAMNYLLTQINDGTNGLLCTSYSIGCNVDYLGRLIAGGSSEALRARTEIRDYILDNWEGEYDAYFQPLFDCLEANGQTPT